MNIDSDLASRVPDHTLYGLRRYVEDHIPTGGFLTAVLSNDLRLACEYADLENQPHIFDIVNFLYNEAPAACWGSPERVEQWLKARKAGV